MLEGGAAIGANFKIVMDREHEADYARRLIAMRRTFITPFDRSNSPDKVTAEQERECGVTGVACLDA
jgi:hypothetical protein